MKLWSLTQIPSDEKNNILSQHKTVYDGYRTMLPKVENEQPLYVQDFAKDKVGATLTTDGTLKPYTDYRVNEMQVMDTCNECGGMMKEGECSECGWKGDMNEINLKDVGEKFKEYLSGRKKQIKTPYTAEAVQKIINLIKTAKTEEHLESAMQMFRNLKETNDDLVEPYVQRIMTAYRRKADELGNYLNKMEAAEEKETCNECGGMMKEGECSECGWKNEMEENKLEESLNKLNSVLNEIVDNDEDLIDDYEKVKKLKEKDPVRLIGQVLGMGSKAKEMGMSRITVKLINMIRDAKDVNSLYAIMNHYNSLKNKGFIPTVGAQKKIQDEFYGKLVNLGQNVNAEMYEEKGHLDDIYKVRDLSINPNAEFDYVEGGGNKYGTFEKMHHMKNIKNESATSNTPLSFGKHYKEIEEPYNFKSNGPVGDGGTLRQKSLEEGGFTGGGNAPDFDIDFENPAYDFVSDGPDEDTFTIPADDMNLDKSKVKKPFDFISGGVDNGGEAYPVNEDGECDECYEKMESAWSDEEELDEVDISGVQGVYDDAKKPYAFVSTGPGKAGPYQTHSWGGEELSGYEGEDEDAYWEVEKDEVNPDKINKDASWEEITSMTGEDEFSNLEEEQKEKIQIQKDKIQEMFQRFSKFN